MKADSASWKLIGERDLGELHKKKIVIKGRAAPVPADASDDTLSSPQMRLIPCPSFRIPLRAAPHFAIAWDARGQHR